MLIGLGVEKLVLVALTL